VWKHPLRELSQRFGVSDVAVGKACGRMRVPRPPTGYWLIRSAGKRARVEVPLQPLPQDAPERMRVWVISPQREAVEPPTGTPKREPLKIPVPGRLANPHPLVAQAREVLKNRNGYYKRLRCLNISVSAEHLSRALRIMDAVIKGLESRGHRVTVGERESRSGWDQDPPIETQVRIGDDHVAIRLIERMKENRHTDSDGRRPRYLSTGRLRFEITTYLPDPKPRLSWSDGRRQRLEDFVGEIVEGLEVAVERAREWRLH
jgi:hypothetical protein